MFHRKPARFEEPFTGIIDGDALEALLSAPGQTLLYLHDPWCPINTRAMSELDALPGPIHTVDVSTQRDLSHAIAQRTGIQHQSPQAILLVDGQPVWHASHHRISRSGVLEAIALQDQDSGSE
ncbi:MAG: monothiol bacilliredoxin BrxC family protein [Thermomicrobiales bacterium]